jgi:hypothetical protein
MQLQKLIYIYGGRIYGTGRTRRTVLSLLDGTVHTVQCLDPCLKALHYREQTLFGAAWRRRTRWVCAAICESSYLPD